MLRPHLIPALGRAIGTTCAVACVASAASAQDGDARQPGTLDKAYEALVGDGTDVLRVDQPEIEVERPPSPPPPPRPEVGEWFYEAGAFIEQYGALDPSGAEEFQVRRNGVGLSATRPGEGGSSIGVSLGFELTNYEFDDVTSLAPGVVEPVQDTFLGELAFRSIGDQRETWSHFFQAGLQLAGESDAETSESLSWRLIAAANRRVDEDFSYTFGALVRSALEDDTLVVPIFGVNWRIDERSRLLTRGPSLSYEYDLSDTRSLFGTFAFAAREYRLDGTGPLPGAALSDRELRLFGGLEFRPGVHEALGMSDSLARIYVGTVMYHELAFFDAGGNELFAIEQDPTLLIGASLRLTF